MVEFRPLNLDEDRDFALQMYLVRAFESEPEDVRRKGFGAFVAHEAASELPGLELRAIAESLQDPRTIAEIIAVDGVDAGMAWVTFGKVPGRYTDYAELRSLAFLLRFQRHGLGRLTIEHLATVAKERGAKSIRSTGSAPSEAIRRFHAATGFEPIQTVFERQL